MRKQPQVLGKEQGGLYLVNSSTFGSGLPSTSHAVPGSVAAFSMFEIWHCRLGHPSSQHMSKIQGLPCKAPTSICRICPQAKQHRSSFPLSVTKTSRSFELLHVDIWGPYRTSTYDGFRLFLSVVDDFTRGTWIFLLSHKSNAFHMLESFITYIKTQHHSHVQIIRSDNGTEFGDTHALSCLLYTSDAADE